MGEYMRVLNDIELKSYTTFKMGGICKTLYIPTTQHELIELASTRLHPLLIGGGSNLLINDKRIFDEVISLREFDTSIKHLGNGEFVVGASVRLQKLIKFINDLGFGGIEYLYSVPALIGGAIYMNAGRGRAHGKCISDYVLDVKVLHDGKVKYLTRDECDFSYRHSVFQTGEYVILSARFKFDAGDSRDFEAAIRERLDHCKIQQDASKPNFGTVFCHSDSRVMRLVYRLDLRKQKGVYFSHKTRNWLINEGGTFSQAIFRLNLVKALHRLIARPCKTEVVIWK